MSSSQPYLMSSSSVQVVSIICATNFNSCCGKSKQRTFDLVFADVDVGRRRRGVGREKVYHLDDVDENYVWLLSLAASEYCVGRIVNLASTCGV